MITIALGPDDSMVRDAVRNLLQQLDPDGHNTTRMDGRSVRPSEVQFAASSASFFGTGRVVVVDDLLQRLGKTTAGVNWAELFSAIPQENALILTEPGLSSVPAAVKKALPKDARILSGDPPRGRELLRWMVEIAKEQDAQLSERDAQVLAEQLYPQSWSQKASNPAYDRPPDLGMLRNEIARLALSAYPEPVTAHRIRQEVVRGDEDRIFKFLDAAMSGNLPEALAELDRLLVAGEEPARLLAQLSQNLELTLAVSHSGHRDPAEVGKAIGVTNPSRVNVLNRTAQRTQPEHLEQSVRAATLADRRIKRGELKDPLDGLHELLTRLAMIRRR